MEEMIAFFYNTGDLSLMLCSFLCYLLILFSLAVIVCCIRKGRLY